MKKIFGAIVFFPFLFLAAVPFVCAAEDPIVVETIPDQTTVDVGMMFRVKAWVFNNSNDTIGFWAQTCSVEKQWVTDSQDVLIQPWTCEENGLEEIDLEPGDGYEKSIILYIPKREKTGPVTFRLGFKRMDESGEMTEPVWGDSVKMHVAVSGGNPPGETAMSPEAPGATSQRTESDTAPTYTDPAAPIRTRAGETFLISLESNPSTGYSWKMDPPEGDKTLELLDSRDVASSAPMPGAPGKQVYTLRALSAGQTKINFIYQRPWEPGRADQREIFTVVVE